jgi:hypothetical protein
MSTPNQQSPAAQSSSAPESLDFSPETIKDLDATSTNGADVRGGRASPGDPFMTVSCDKICY